jgi:hypothetical protein
MAALAYTLVFAVFLGLLAADASNIFLQGGAYLLCAWLFVTSIVLAVRQGKK